MADNLVPHIPETTGADLVNPETGVVVTRDSPDDDVIDLLAFLRRGRERLDELDGEISQWLRERADARGKWTLAGGRASMPSNREQITWNQPALLETLERLHEEGAIKATDLERVAPMERRISFTELKALRERSLPAVVEQIDDAQVRVPKSARPVKIRDG